ncbi:signal peptidase I [Microbacteriaceae bacterium VKM Ac-2855]|nr:signal peptidase I [Microbacteriaceae bacterium VKM Ac-2855]
MRLFRALTGTLVGVAVLAAVAVFALSALGLVRFVPVLSNSMAPQMPTGSLAVTVPVAQTEIAAGDVIVFTDPDDPSKRVIHRVESLYPADEAAQLVGWQPGMIALHTRGDNNESADPWILTIADSEVWRRSAVVPYLGWPTIAFGDPRSRVVLFGVGGALVAAWLLAAIWRRPAAATPEPTTPEATAPEAAAAPDSREMPLVPATRRELRAQEASREREGRS